jgi:hypothetical protein
MDHRIAAVSDEAVGGCPAPQMAAPPSQPPGDRNWRRLAFSSGSAMVRAMTRTPRLVASDRRFDDSVVTCAADIAGARHEVLPPRCAAAGGRRSRATLRAAPP